MTRAATQEYLFFAATCVGLGVLGLVYAPPPIWSGVPREWAQRNVVFSVSSVVMLLSGVGLLVPRTALNAARVLLGYFVLWMLAFRVYLIVQAPTSSGVWWAVGATGVLIGAALAVHAYIAGAGTGRLAFLSGDRGVRMARILCGLGVIPFGIAHFTFLDRTLQFIPAWLPGHLFWAYATGSAFIAAGLAMTFNVLPRLAANLLTLQIALFTLIVWVPIVLGHPSAGDWAEFIESWTLAAATWMVAGTYRELPWLRTRA